MYNEKETHAPFERTSDDHWITLFFYVSPTTNILYGDDGRRYDRIPGVHAIIIYHVASEFSSHNNTLLSDEESLLNPMMCKKERKKNIVA